MIDRNQLLYDKVFNVNDQDSLVALLKTREESGGLGWPVDTDEPFHPEKGLKPKIAPGVNGNNQVNVSHLIAASVDQPYLVLLAEFDKPYVRRDLLELLKSLRSEIRETGQFADYTGLEDTIFIVAAPENEDAGSSKYEDIRFVLFEERGKRLPGIRSFGWRKEFVGRTVLTHNLERLRWSDHQDWKSAWDVEGMTDDFYDAKKRGGIGFVQVFDAVKAATTHPGGEEKKHAYVQQLLNRLLFIAFVERMEWGPRTPEGDSNYLHAQWQRFQKGDCYKEIQDKELVPATFNNLLQWLFFRALDAPNGVKPTDQLYPILGEVPYLNGGLFSEEADLDVPGVAVADEVFDLILGDRRPGFEGGLFQRFNFTVTESRPLDQEAAVDPEMLGKIFERIIVAEERHRTGTYYTPRPIVEFMVNEALKGYLVERGLSADKAALLVDNDTVESDALSFKASEMQDTLDWLFEVRAVDPACGSGAYLLMLLQRLFELADRLEVVRNKRRNLDQKHAYNTKLRLLERCVYGVDKSETAVRIARLRLWLSLVVENKGVKPEPLPSFDFLIMCGDSLASPVKPNQHPLGYPHDAIRDYTRMKRRYFHPAGGEQRPTRDEMTTKRAEIAQTFLDEFANSRLRSLAQNPFDWEVDFAEVFDPQESEETVDGLLNPGVAGGRGGQGELAAVAARLPGFDIVLANPPYVNSGELLRSVGLTYKQALVSSFPHTSTGNVDLLVYFFDRALQLLRAGGHLAFITSNKWLKAAYGDKLRSHITRTAHVRNLIDFRDLPVFQNVVAYPVITIAQKRRQPLKGTEAPNEEARITSVYTLDAPFPDVAELVRMQSKILLPGALGVNGIWQLESGANADRIRRMSEGRTTLGDWLTYRVYRGVTTGLNEVRRGPDGQLYSKGETAPAGSTNEGVFIIDRAKRKQLIDEDENSAEIIKPLVTGKDIKRWIVPNCVRWIILTKIGTDMRRYPAVMRHLEQFKEKLIPRADQGEHWWELRACAYYNEFEKAKIVSTKISLRPTFAYSDAKPPVYLGNTAYGFSPKHPLYVLALLNSTLAEEWSKKQFLGKQGEYYEVQPELLERFPIPDASEEERTTIEGLVQQILDSKAVNPNVDIRAIEAEIDRRVEFLYFGSEAGRTYNEAMAHEREDIRNLLRRPAEDATLEFKETLWWDVKQGQYHGDRVLDIAKAVCAMINRDGGTILIGVADEGNRPIGIKRDLERLETPDKFQRKIAEPFGQKLRPDPSDLVRVKFIDLDGALICRVDVRPDRTTMYHLNDKVYIRRDGESRDVSGTDLAYWWSRRQKGEV